MAIGSDYTESDNKLFIVKIKTKTIDKETGKDVPALPHVLQILEKVEGKWIAQEKYQNQFSGDLTKIEFGEGEWEGSKYQIIKLKFEDHEAKESYLLDCRTSSDFRSLANSILSLDPKNLTGLKVRTYKKKGKTGDKEYSNIGLYQNDEFVKGKYSWEEMPPVQKIKFKGKDMSDTQELDSWTIEKLKEFAAQMNPVPKAAKAPKKESVGDYHDVSQDLESSEIPF